MALRSLGSSLLAKARPGGILRQQAETRATQYLPPTKAQPGNISRIGAEEPILRQPSPGSEKIVAAKPTIEGTTVESIPGIPEVTPAVPEAILPEGAREQAMFQAQREPTFISRPSSSAGGGGGQSSPQPTRIQAQPAPTRSIQNKPANPNIGLRVITDTNKGQGLSLDQQQAGLRSLGLNQTSLSENKKPVQGITKATPQAAPTKKVEGLIPTILRSLGIGAPKPKSVRV